MQKAWLVLFLFASVYAESVRETETWMPMKPQADDSQDLVSSGDRPGSDFGFVDEDDLDADDDDDNYDDLDTMYDDYDDEDYDDEDDDDSFSGSGDEESTDVNTVPIKPDLIDNKIPDQDKPVRPKPTSNDIEAVINNEVGLRVGEMPEEGPGNVLMTQAQNENILGKPEVLAALIAGGAVGLLFAILLILLLIYRMKKKDEGSYDLGKKPIYTKAPTTEIYA